MRYDTTLQGRPLTVELTPPAAAALARRAQPLAVHMELYFSCLIRKAVRFGDGAGGDGAGGDGEGGDDAGDNGAGGQADLHGLVLHFRPVTSRGGCAVDGGAPPLETMPMTHPARYIPRWLRLDFRAGAWSGEFGYAKP